MGGAIDFRRITAKADDLLKKYGYTRPAIDPERIAEGEGLRVVYADFTGRDASSVSGFFRLTDRTIFVNNATSANRITFTIAHELAHFVLHKDYIASRDYRPMPRNNVYLDEKPIEEREADWFAASLLVPLRMLKAYRSFGSTDELSRLFFVSEEVIDNRLDLLERHPRYAR